MIWRSPHYFTPVHASGVVRQRLSGEGNIGIPTVQRKWQRMDGYTGHELSHTRTGCLAPDPRGSHFVAQCPASAPGSPQGAVQQRSSPTMPRLPYSHIYRSHLFPNRPWRPRRLILDSHQRGLSTCRVVLRYRDEQKIRPLRKCSQ